MAIDAFTGQFVEMISLSAKPLFSALRMSAADVCANKYIDNQPGVHVDTFAGAGIKVLGLTFVWNDTDSEPERDY